MNDLKAIKAMLAAITQGEWEWDQRDGNIWCETNEGASFIMASVPEDGARWAAAERTINGTFIALGPQYIRALVDELELLRQIANLIEEYRQTEATDRERVFRISNQLFGLLEIWME